MNDIENFLLVLVTNVVRSFLLLLYWLWSFFSFFSLNSFDSPFTFSSSFFSCFHCVMLFFFHGNVFSWNNEEEEEEKKEKDEEEKKETRMMMLMLIHSFLSFQWSSLLFLLVITRYSLKYFISRSPTLDQVLLLMTLCLFARVAHYTYIEKIMLKHRAFIVVCTVFFLCSFSLSVRLSFVPFYSVRFRLKIIVVVTLNTIEFDDVVEGDVVTIDCLPQKSTA